MKKVIIAFTGVLVLSGCSQPEGPAVEKATPSPVHQEGAKSAVTPTKLLTMEIGGMSCEMGCGAAIRKELLATDAVERVKFDFKMGRDLNTAEISYDASKISEDKITAIVSRINDKQFTIGSTSVKDYEKPAEEANASQVKHSVRIPATDKSFTQLESSESFGIKTPNLIDLLVSALIRR